jgi:6-phosphogluconolactonase
MFVANQRSNNVTTFAVDRRTGGLAETSSFSIPIPVCVLPTDV